MQIDKQNKKDKCPLCGELNSCGVENKNQTCWCMQEKFPQEIFEQIPASAQNCICKKCYERLKNKTNG